MSQQTIKSSWVNIQVLVGGRPADLFWNGARHFLEAKYGYEFSLVITNVSLEPLLAVTVVDGLNVLNEEAASIHGMGMILQAQQRWECKGRLARIGAQQKEIGFRFVRPEASVAAQLLQPASVGTIGFAIWRTAQAVAREQAWQQFERPQAFGGFESDVDYSVAKGGLTRGGTAGAGTGRVHNVNYGTGNFDRATSPVETFAVQFETFSWLQAYGIIPQTYPTPILTPAWPGDDPKDTGYEQFLRSK